MRLPPLYLITDTSHPQDFFVRLQQVLNAGVSLIQLRLPGLDENQYSALAKPAITMCRRAKTTLLLNCSPRLAIELEADGIHLPSYYLTALHSRPLPYRTHQVAASCHNKADLAAAHHVGADFVVLAPVLPTPTHPDAPTLGWDNFRELVTHARTPVYALGGMTPTHLPIAQNNGAAGIAILSAIWKSNNIPEAIRACQLEKK